MMAISSFRKLSDNSEVAENQLRAFESWSKVFDTVILFGKEEFMIDWPNFEFVDAGDFPKIQTLALACSLADDMACIINSDIVVSPALYQVIQEVVRKGGQCATSRRYEFNPKSTDFNRAKIVDNGVDFFCAYPDLWKICVREIPKTFRIGHCAWDSWMLGFFNTLRPRAFWDISKRRCIFHPKHGSRKRTHEILPVQDKYVGNCGFPTLRL